MQQATEQEVQKENAAIETAVHVLWDKAKAASLLIVKLREEKALLQQRIADLEYALSQVEIAGQEKDTEISRLKEEISILLTAPKDNGVLTAEARAAMQEKIKKLLLKIETYLQQ